MSDPIVFDPTATFVIDNVIVGIKSISILEENGDGVDATVDYDVTENEHYPLPEYWQEVVDKAMPKFINDLLKQAIKDKKLERDSE